MRNIYNELHKNLLNSQKDIHQQDQHFVPTVQSIIGALKGVEAATYVFQDIIGVYHQVVVFIVLEG